MIETSPSGPGCLLCGTGIDIDRQCTVTGGRLLGNSIPNPFTGEDEDVYYCWPCAVKEFPDLPEEFPDLPATAEFPLGEFPF